ncbi:neuronal vesicle trafficking-associated protein 1-like [Synchiropus splendidus]|uniref:neuronal vesicle trafficking-associated protein 1-like n=1 Tax=Synchiropus splendidus TaxID=270530 RepID=UPI00237D7CCD|nr:neuronal vesicle trafficking-associated protein 1-like [Synchiropus splendidus]
MVKLGTSLSDKLQKESSLDDGFDNIPLITPLEVNQLQHSFPEKVIVKTAIKHSLQQRSKFGVPTVRKMKRSCEVSERAKISGLIFIMLASLTSLVLLLMFQTLWYHQLTCPAGFVLKQSHCIPVNLELLPNGEQQEPGFHTTTGLYTALSNLNKVKKSGPQLTSPWLPVIGSLKEAGKEAASKPLEREE